MSIDVAVFFRCYLYEKPHLFEKYFKNFKNDPYFFMKSPPHHT